MANVLNFRLIKIKPLDVRIIASRGERYHSIEITKSKIATFVNVFNLSSRPGGECPNFSTYKNKTVRGAYYCLKG